MYQNKHNSTGSIMIIVWGTSTSSMMKDIKNDSQPDLLEHITGLQDFLATKYGSKTTLSTAEIIDMAIDTSISNLRRSMDFNKELRRYVSAEIRTKTKRKRIFSNIYKSLLFTGSVILTVLITRYLG